MLVQSHIQLARYYIIHIIGAYSKNIYVFDISSCTLVRILVYLEKYVCYNFNMDIHPIHDTPKLSPHIHR